MSIKEYMKEYTAGKGIYFKDVLGEVKELLFELFKLNSSGIKEESQDVLHFLQLWLYCRFGINGEIWSITGKSVAKFMNRKKVWQKIYEFAGLDKDISGYAGNYNKRDKVINHLSKFGVNRERAEETYKIIVENKFE